MVVAMKKYLIIFLFSFCFAQEKIPVQIIVDYIGMGSINNDTQNFLKSFSYEIKNSISNSSNFKPYEASTDTVTKIIIQLSAKQVISPVELFAYDAIFIFVSIGQATLHFEGSVLDVCKTSELAIHSNKIISSLKKSL